MRRGFVGFALSAMACAQLTPSQPAAESPRAAAVVEVPPPVADATAPRSSSDAGAPHVAHSVEPDASPDVSIDGGVGVSAGGTWRFGTGDAGLTFDGSVMFKVRSPAKLSPDLIVHSALLVPSKAPSASFGKYELLLFEGKADCAHRQGRHITMSTAWKRGASSKFMTMSIMKGHSEHYKGRIEVLLAPTAPGSTGAIRLPPTPDGNVRGGRVPVHVCR